jgi:hypothetical protein
MKKTETKQILDKYKKCYQKSEAKLKKQIETKQNADEIEIIMNGIHSLIIICHILLDTF